MSDEREAASRAAEAALREAESKANSVAKEEIERLRAQFATASRLLSDAQARIEERDTQLKPRVYIHISSEEQRAGARFIGEAIAEAEAVVPGIQNVGAARSPPTSEFRYFRRSERQLAEAIHSELVARGFPLTLQYVPGFESSSARPNHFEIWLAADWNAETEE